MRPVPLSDGTTAVHIGLDKTGTTTVQSFFSGKNRDLLAPLNLEYFPHGIRSNHHFDLARALGFGWRNSHIADQSILSFDWDQSGRYFISSEHFSFGATDENIGKLQDFLAGMEVHIIVVYRAVSSWLRSMYGESIKWGSSLGFEAFVESHLDRVIDLGAFHGRWVNHFGRDRVHSVIYEETGGDVLSSILDLLGYPDDSKRRGRAITERANQSLDLIGFEALRLLNREVADGDTAAAKARYEKMIRYIPAAFDRPRLPPAPFTEAHSQLIRKASECLIDRLELDEAGRARFMQRTVEALEGSRDEVAETAVDSFLAGFLQFVAADANAVDSTDQGEPSQF